MRKITFYIFLLISTQLFAQTDWTQKANFPGVARANDVGFSIGHYGFVGCGTTCSNSYENDFYKYNANTNTWTSIPNYPGAGQYSCVACAIEGEGYVGMGWTGSYSATDLWRYDTISNSWTQMATFPGAGRYSCSPFVVGHKAYFVGGSKGGPPYLSDVWVYDAHQNTWKQLNNYPDGDIEGYVTFAIGNHGYLGNGWNSATCSQNMYEYDTSSDTWTIITPIPTSYGIADFPSTWTIGSKGYVVTGGVCTSLGVRDGWVYDTVSKSWCEFSYIAGSKLARGNGPAFCVNNHGYICTGNDTNINCLADLWEYTPSSKFTVADTSKCGNDTVHFSGTTNYLNPTWSWSFPGGNPTTSNLQNPEIIYSTSGTYSVTLIVNACGGIDTFKRTITVVGGTLAFPIKGKTSLCIGSLDTLTATGGGTYKWSTGQTSNSIMVAPSSNSVYTVTITDSGGCTSSTTFQVNVALPVDSITGPSLLCPGDSIILYAMGGNSYLWSNGATTSSIEVYPIKNTTYYVANACHDTARKTVFVDNTDPFLYACCDTIIQIPGTPVMLDASGATHFYWEPSSEVSCDSCPNPIVTPTITTTYTVIGIDSVGCRVERTVTIDVSGCYFGNVPNVFTPNGDGINDNFVIYTFNILGYSISIYDRWGLEMFHSTNPNEYWDGNTQSGGKAPEGVYYYILNYSCYGKSFNKDGFLQLVR